MFTQHRGWGHTRQGSELRSREGSCVNICHQSPGEGTATKPGSLASYCSLSQSSGSGEQRRSPGKAPWLQKPLVLVLFCCCCCFVLGVLFLLFMCICVCVCLSLNAPHMARGHRSSLIGIIDGCEPPDVGAEN